MLQRMDPGDRIPALQLWFERGGVVVRQELTRNKDKSPKGFKVRGNTRQVRGKIPNKETRPRRERVSGHPPGRGGVFQALSRLEKK